MIRIDSEGNDVYRVTVDSRVSTTHRVTLTDAECRRIGGGEIAPQRLIEESFRFLLEREPNTSILQAFELRLIGRYFPEYEATIRGRLRRQ